MDTDRMLVRARALAGPTTDRLTAFRAGAGARAVAVAVAVIATGLLALIVLGSPSYGLGVLAAIALPLLLARHALSLVLFLAFITQEVVREPENAFFTTLGNQSYYAGKVPLIVIVAVTAAALTLFRLRATAWAALRPAGRAAAATIAGLILLTLAAGFLDGQNPLSAINQNARPFIVLGVGMIIGVGLGLSPAERRTATGVAGFGLIAMVLGAAYSVAAGEAADARVSPYFIFYDSGLPALAVAIFLALVLRERPLVRSEQLVPWRPVSWRRPRSWRLPSWRSVSWRPIIVMAAAVVILVASFRIGVWISTAAAVAAILVLGRHRLVTLRRIGLALAGLALLLVVTPGLATDVQSRLLGASSGRTAPTSPDPGGGGQDPSASGPTGSTGSTGGSGAGSPGGSHGGGAGSGGGGYTTTVGGGIAEDSAGGHVRDLSVGWDYVKENFWTGVGPRAYQLPGLAASRSERVYVHDEWLLDWLRFGPIAALLVTALLLVVGIEALKTLRRPRAGLVNRTAAMFALLTPVCLVPFPFLSTTSRWPLLFGIAAGLLGVRTRVVGEFQPLRTSSDRATS